MATPIIAGELTRRVGEVANTPVIGSKTTTIRKTKAKTIIEERSVQLRGWELAAIGLAGAIGFLLVGEELGLITKEEDEFDFGKIGLAGVLVPPIGIAQGFGLIPQF